MDVEISMLPSVNSRDLYVRAKIEHYHDLAEECRSAGRYHAALRLVDSILVLEPDNRGALNLQNSVNSCLKLISCDPGSNGHELRPTNGHSRSEIIMVADQDARVLANLIDTFERSGFPAVGAGSYDEALEVLMVSAPHVIISEVNFETGPRGYDLFEQVRTTKRQDALFFLLTTRHDRDAELVGRRLGVDDFFVKPVDAQSIVATINRLLSRKHA